ncbi:MAG: QueT transporter family protein [Erysipelotrichaceae bacterium]|nr:QueT transporter family protein [Erysipelotrichaceae bacterium]
MNSKKIALYALVIGAYTALSLVLGTFSFGAIQVRVAEVLVLLCLIKLEYTIPLTAACLVTNIIGILMGINFPLDFIFGTLATLLSCLLAYRFRNVLWYKKPVLSLLMPCIVNAVIIGWEIMFYTASSAEQLSVFVASALSVFVGEFISCVVLGVVLYEPFMGAYKRLMGDE